MFSANSPDCVTETEDFNWKKASIFVLFWMWWWKPSAQTGSCLVQTGRFAWRLLPMKRCWRSRRITSEAFPKKKNKRSSEKMPLNFTESEAVFLFSFKKDLKQHFPMLMLSFVIFDSNRDNFSYG